MASKLIGITAGCIAFHIAAPPAQACETIAPVGEPPYLAEDYPMPLSLRINLRQLMKRELHAAGHYAPPDSQDQGTVFTYLLKLSIKQLQAKAFREKPETQIFAKRSCPIIVSRVSPSTSASG